MVRDFDGQLCTIVIIPYAGKPQDRRGRCKAQEIKSLRVIGIPLKSQKAAWRRLIWLVQWGLKLPF